MAQVSARRKFTDFTDKISKKMAVAKPKEQWIFGNRSVCKSATFVQVRGDLDSSMDWEVSMVIGLINTLKENVPKFPFGNGVAQSVIRRMLQQMPREK